MVDVLFVPLVISLAIGVGSLPALLSTRLMVFGGQISFCLYMVHELVHTAWGWAVQQYELALQDQPWKWNVVGLLAIALGLRSCCITSSKNRAADGCAGWSTSKPRVREASPGAGRQHALSNRRCAGRGFGPRGVTVEWGCSGSTRVHIGFLVRFP